MLWSHKCCGHILRMSKEEPARRYALYIPTIGKRRPGWPHTSYLNYVQRLLGDNEGAMQEQQIATFADDHHAWRNLVVACSAANGWWWWWWWWWCDHKMLSNIWDKLASLVRLHKVNDLTSDLQPKLNVQTRCANQGSTTLHELNSFHLITVVITHVCITSEIR